jgi:hypothetical protein
MPQFFTYCWQHRELLLGATGAPVGTAWGSQFAQRGIKPGDEVYIVSAHRGRINLLGKMRVRAVLHSEDEYRRLTGEDPTPGAEYLVAEACTPGQRVELSEETMQRLRFLKGKQEVGLTFREVNQVDPQSIRSVRRLSADSAAMLDRLLPAMQPFRPLVEVSP